MSTTIALDVESDAELVAATWAGDDRAMAELLRRYAPRVRAIARGFFLRNGGADGDDLVQEGMIGLYKAICDFDPERHVLLSTFAEVCVRRQLISAVRAANRRKHAILDRAEWLDEHAAFAPSVRTDEPEHALLAREALGELAGFATESLTPLEHDALRCHLEGRSRLEAAAALQREPKAMDNALQRARRKLSCWISASDERWLETVALR